MEFVPPAPRDFWTVLLQNGDKPLQIVPVTTKVSLFQICDYLTLRLYSS